MATTKPMRIFESDHAPFRLIASAEGRSVPEIAHSALSEYFENHREELAAVFAEAQAAFKSGDIDRVSDILARSRTRRVDELMASLPTLETASPSEAGSGVSA